jgi:lantibiotic leader peptide-processing serine protease
MSLARSNRFQTHFVAALLCVAACAEQVATPTAPADLRRVTGAPARVTAANRFIVHFKADAVSSDFADRIAALGATLIASYDGAGLAVVDGLDAVALAQLAAAGDIEVVDADNVFRFIDSPSRSTTIDVNLGANSPTNPTTAFLYPFQWNMRAIRADAAWAAGQVGSPAVKVAIIDTGIDYLHPDLAGRVDLANSASFVPAEDPFVPLLFPGREVFTDLNYHGTHIAATVSSNALLAAGVTSRTTLMAIKVLDVNGDGSTSAFVGGIIYAADRGANVLNLSLGVEELLDRTDKDIRAFERAFERVLRYARSRGATIIVSAGNEAQDLDAKQTFKVFCGMQNVVCVSATGPTSQGSVAGPWQNIDAPAGYSNFGHTAIEVAAPGGNGTSLVFGPCSTTSLVFPACQSAFFALGLQGTSQAAPHVSGTAALILAKEGSMSPSSLKSALGRTADDLGKAGRDDRYGRGRINVQRALGL